MRRPIDVFGHLSAQLASVTAQPAALAVAGPAGTASPGASPPGDGAASPAPSVAGTPAAWSADMARASRLVGAGPARPGTSDLFLPNDAELAGVSFSSAGADGAAIPISAVQVRLRTGEARDLAATGPVDWALPTPVPLQDLEEVRASSTATARFDGRMTLQLSYRGARFPLTAPLAVGAQAVLAVVLTIGVPESGAELLDHLQQHRLHYSQAIWRWGVDASNIALLLSPYTFESLPVADLIDPNPIMIAGNYLVFRMPGFTRTAGLQENSTGAGSAEAEAAIHKSWDAWLDTRGLVLGADAAAEELVSVPTGGVFAEAVLGRSNSAELLDASRFWNWQDSPIPLQPPEIAAIQLESRAQPQDVTPGQLAPPVVNITNPTALPDPTGLGPMLAALQNGNMFRDMSGLAATLGLAQALGQATSTAATEAGRQAAANLSVAAQKDIEEKRIAAQLAMAAMGAGTPGGGPGTPKNITESGALLNTAKVLDAQAPRGGSPGGTSGAPSAGGGASQAGGSGGGGSLMSRADDVLRRALWGNMGVPVADIVPAALGGAGAAAGSTGGATSTTPPDPWHAAIAQIYEHIDASGVPAINWTGRGTAPMGYLKGVALTYARVYCHYSLEPGEPENFRDRFAVQMAKAVGPGASTTTDAVARFATDLQALSADLSVDGVDVLRGLFTILIGLGMRESSGKYCTGWDRSKSIAPTAENSEAGLFQISYDIGVNAGDFGALYEKYQQRPNSGFLDVFSEGVTCGAADWANVGAGPGKDFQQFCKDCPAFTVELAALGLRSRANHWGPINTRTVEIREECWKLLRAVETAIDDLDGCIAVA
jgi:hypothetical protein